MKWPSFFLSGIAVVGLPLATMAAQDTWVNNGTIVTPPAIDATNVINNGVIGPLFTSQPFDTSNTQNLTNSGTMSGAIGFRFDNAPRNSSGQLIGLRKPSANFHNRNSGVINAQDGITTLGFAGSIFYVQATNLINQGILTVGAGGLMQLTGDNVNLSRGGFGAVSIGNNPAALRSDNDSLTAGHFYPALAVTDNHWGQTNMEVNVATLLDAGLGIHAPTHTVGGTPPFGTTAITLNTYQFGGISNVLRFANVTVTNASGSITNILVPTNILMQAAFVGLPFSGNPSVNIEFVPSSQPTNDHYSVLVTMITQTTNVISGQLESGVVYLQDTLAGEVDRGLLTNYLTTLAGQTLVRTMRPRAYVLSRTYQGFDLQNQPVQGNAAIFANFFYAPYFATNRVLAAYAGYSGSFDNIVIRPPNIPAGTATNLTGRAEVRSGSLDLTRARIRGEGLVSLQTTHLVGSSNAVVDCENLSLDLGSTNGLLRIKDLTKTTVSRMRGPVSAWSAQWSNSFQIVLTNYNTATNPVVLEPITNTVGVLYHTLVYDLRSLSTVVPAVVQQFKGSATNIVMDDSANVALELILNAQSFTLNGQLNLTNGVTTWRATNAPGLRYFTNNGALSIPNEAHFGDDAPLNYLGFVNRGAITSFGQNIDSVYAELAGTNTSSSTFNLRAVDAKVESGRVTAQGDVLFYANTLKLNRGFLQSADRLVLTITNSLSDNGPTSSNTLVCGDGLILQIKPALGDLLGTTIRSTAPNFGLVSHYWAGEDRGTMAAGFSNNAAVGRLTLVPNGVGTAFEFIGTGAANGLYVEVLDLAQLTDIAEQLIIYPNITIYYASAKLGFVPPGGVSPEEYLNNQFGGHLRWVSQYAGANSSVDVIINGNQTIKVNKALRDSTTIDSDSDGVPNFYDASPFDGVKIKSIVRSASPAGFVLSWDAAPNTVYRVEYRVGLSAATWDLLLMTTNSASGTVPWSVTDTNVASGPQRYYRVTYNPNGP